MAPHYHRDGDQLAPQDSSFGAIHVEDIVAPATKTQNYHPSKSHDGPQDSGYGVDHKIAIETTRGSSGGSTDDVIVEQDGVVRPPLLWSRIRRVHKEAFSEFLSTFVLILFSDGVVAQVVLSGGEKGDYQSISWGWGLGVMLGVYTSGYSGAHINPAVTFASCVFRRFPWKKFPIYTLAQILGAMCASAVVYGNYISAIDAYEGYGVRTVPGYSNTSSAGIFCTYPAEFMTRTGMFFSELVASAILMLVIFALKDDDNIGAGPLTPLALFFLIFGIGACFGWETGYAINLARDFGPRLMSYMLGYGPNVWRAGNYYFWIPMVAPFIGTTFGGFLYDVLLNDSDVSPVNTPWLGLKRILVLRRSRRDSNASGSVV